MRVGNLPEENARKRQTRILIALWTLGFINWIVYTAINVHYKETKQFEVLWNFNFFSSVLLCLLVGLTLFYFGHSYINIRRLYTMLGNNSKNTKTLTYLKSFTGIAFLVQMLFMLFEIAGICTQGYYGWFPIYVSICQSLSL